MKNVVKMFLVLVLSFAFITPFADAYVSVKGHYRNGTYVAPYVRSNPNGLKYDNYGYTASQGLYNKSYGTKGTTWDTPTYITDSSYYIGKSLYESKNVSSATVPSYKTTTLPVLTGYTIQPVLKTTSTTNKKVKVPKNASLNYSGNDWYCDSGYKTKYDESITKVGCEKILVPKNASLNYSGNDWYCDSGYKTKYDESITKVGCEKILVPKNASLNYSGNDWYCDSGYKTKYDESITKVGCEKILVPKNASLNYSGNDWYCDSGYKTKYDESITKVGCEKKVQ